MLDFQGALDGPPLYAVVMVVMIEAVILAHAGRHLERRLTSLTAGVSNR
jgi:hypothetical protein